LTDKKTILLVDDEHDFLAAMQRNFIKYLDSVNVMIAASGQEALGILARESIDLIVADFMMPEITGLDLLFRIRSQWPNIDIIIMTGFCTAELRQTAEKNGCCRIFEKPFPMSDMRDAIMDILSHKQKGFTGILKRIHLSDLIQMCCMDGATESIRIRKGAGESFIHIHDGEIIGAQCGDLNGEDAFFRIMGWPDGSFETLTPMPGIQQTINRGWQYLLMEGARRVDEAGPEHQQQPEKEPGQPIRLLIVDDSAIMIRALRDIFSSSDRLTVVGSAANGEEALKRIDELQPDIMTLDINMPVMSGGTALMHIMIKNRCPVVIVSSIANSQSGAQILAFLRLGAVDFLNKPKNSELEVQKRHFIDTICRAAGAATLNFKRSREIPERRPDGAEKPLSGQCKRVVAINSGPGGHADAIRLISTLPAMGHTCCILLQALPDEMVPVFADYIDRRSAMKVVPIYDGAPLTPGNCYIGTLARGWHVSEKQNGSWCLEDHLKTVDKNTDPFFFLARSITETKRLNLMGVLLSGAVVSNGQNLAALSKNGHRIIAHQPDRMMISDFLGDLAGEGPEMLEPEALIETILDGDATNAALQDAFSGN